MLREDRGGLNREREEREAELQKEIRNEDSRNKDARDYKRKEEEWQESRESPAALDPRGEDPKAHIFVPLSTECPRGTKESTLMTGFPVLIAEFPGGTEQSRDSHGSTLLTWADGEEKRKLQEDRGGRKREREVREAEVQKERRNEESRNIGKRLQEKR
ncbi:hypothetical protein NDU88_007379 [Pleurodeles waltl]|uniref:Uncharacterized protein n=1 Tax=Pleurodeles waltl TaxID=8319 RepID=A0AAV7N3J9_PLEWA|nr:hypothetical protein NDU88_007379 [Pleurodeles waltl]